MICPPCAEAADTAPTHPAEICRDAAVQPHGCGCQHRAQPDSVYYVPALTASVALGRD